jgi:hypothetical protein
MLAQATHKVGFALSDVCWRERDAPFGGNLFRDGRQLRLGVARSCESTGTRRARPFRRRPALELAHNARVLFKSQPPVKNAYS